MSRESSWPAGGSCEGDSGRLIAGATGDDGCMYLGGGVIGDGDIG